MFTFFSLLLVQFHGDIIYTPAALEALRDQMSAVLMELTRIAHGEEVPEDLNDTVRFIAQIMDGMKKAT